jgi:dUTP pyrophosphatase
MFTLEPDAQEPTQAYEGDAGWDLHVLEDTTILTGTGKDVRSGVRMALPPGYYARIIGRSSALRRKGVLVVEGVIDAGFRGELFSYCFNPGTETVHLHRGESVAQVIVTPVPGVSWMEVVYLPESKRGAMGFGSSGR